MSLNILAVSTVQQWDFVFSDETPEIISYFTDLKN